MGFMNLFGLNSVDFNEDQLKRISIKIKEYAQELREIKDKADIEWQECSRFLDDDTKDRINNIKTVNEKNFKNNLETLDEEASKLEYIMNVLKDTEEEMKASTIKFESFFGNLEKQLNDILDKNNNK